MEDLFFLPYLKGATNLKRFVFDLEDPFDREKIKRMTHVEGVAALHRTFGEGQVMDCVQYIGFAASVESDHTIDFRTEIQAGFEVVLKLDQV